MGNSVGQPQLVRWFAIANAYVRDCILMTNNYFMPNCKIASLGTIIGLRLCRTDPDSYPACSRKQPANANHALQRAAILTLAIPHG